MYGYFVGICYAQSKRVSIECGKLRHLINKDNFNCALFLLAPGWSSKLAYYSNLVARKFSNGVAMSMSSHQRMEKTLQDADARIRDLQSQIEAKELSFKVSKII